MRPTQRLRPGGRRDRGSATVEAAIVVPVVMLLLMLVVQAGLYFHTRAAAQTAAYKGLDALRVEDGSVPSARDATNTFLDRNAGALETRTIQAERSGDRAHVTVSGEVVSLVFGAHLFPVRVTAAAPIEQVTP